MNRLIRLICLVVVVATILAIPVSGAQGEDTVAPQSSSYFTSYGSSAQMYAGRSFNVLFHVTGKGTMSKLGASAIKIQQSSDQTTWTTMYTFTPDYNPSMLCENTGFHASHVTFAGAPGFYYRAKITFCAKNSTGTGYAYMTTNTVYVSAS